MHGYIFICSFYRYFSVFIPSKQMIPLDSCDYLKKNSIKTNVETDKGNGRNET